MAVKSLRPDLQDQLPVVGLMLASSCFGRKVCPTPPCACAQSLIDAVTNLEIDRLQAAKRAALAIADERSKENVELRAQNAAIMDDYWACMEERDRLRAALRIARRWMPVAPIDQEAKDEVATVDACLAGGHQ